MHREIKITAIVSEMKINPKILLRKNYFFYFLYVMHITVRVIINMSKFVHYFLIGILLWELLIYYDYHTFYIARTLGKIKMNV